MASMLLILIIVNAVHYDEDSIFYIDLLDCCDMLSVHAIQLGKF